MINAKSVAGLTFLTAGLFLLREALVWIYNKALDAAGAKIQIGFDFAGLSWQNAVAFILVGVGATLLIWPKSRQPSDRTKRDDLTQLHQAAASIIRRIRGHRSARWYRRDRLEPIADIARSGLAVLVSFEKKGFQVPQLDAEYVEQIAIGLEAYFSVLFPLLANGHREEALLASAPASEEADRVAHAFNVNTWFQSDF